LPLDKDKYSIHCKKKNYFNHYQNVFNTGGLKIEFPNQDR
jgi:hypothetical protein